MKSLTLLSFFLLNTNLLYTQWSKEIIETDSSKIEIIRNSAYKITEEEFIFKDSIKYCVRYIQDTNQIYTEGWFNKENKGIGTWNYYRIDGTWISTEKHNPYRLTLNDSLFPNRALLEKIKLSADSIIINTYGKTFFEKNIKFNGGCNAYQNSAYVGNWYEPLKDKPNKAKFTYQIDFHSYSHLNQYVSVNVDSEGNHTLSSEDGFDRIPRKFRKKGFNVDRKKMISKFLKKSKVNMDSCTVFEYTVWNKSFKKEKFNGYFSYNIIVNMKEEMVETKHNEKSYFVRTFTYKVYEFNIWSGKLKREYIQTSTSDGTNSYFPASQKWHSVEFE